MFFSFFLFSFDEAFCIRLVCNLEFTDVTLLFSAMRKILANLYVCSIQRNQKTPATPQSSASGENSMWKSFIGEGAW